MEPLSEYELQRLLRTWKAPVAPGHLRPTLPRRSWYTEFWGTSVRIPAPVLALLLLAIIALQLLPRREPPRVAPDARREVRFADFEPVAEAKPVVVRSTRYEDR